MTDNYTKLAHCMDCETEDVPRLIQQHAPWNGKLICDDTLRVVALLREYADSLHPGASTAEEIADAIERGEHRKENE
jgi:hypothetical protein